MNRKQKSQRYHEEVKRRLAEGARKVQEAGHEPPLTVTQQDQAQIEADVHLYEIRRHQDKRGRTVRL